MSKRKPARSRTSDEGRSADEVKADNPKGSLDRLQRLTRKVLKVPKERLDEIRDRST